MPFTHVVVDGSNIATEGRSIPSLAQLDEAVREFKNEYPHAEITVVVDATFGHRIDASERATFDDAVAHGEMVSPPAGAIGRGDAFLLRIADRSGATVLSNDSFQEFHGEYEWLFTKDRLIGGKPVPAVGWIFTPRTPVRGPKSRESMREARKSRVRVGSKEASRPMPVPKAPPPRPGSGTSKERKAGLTEAIAAATEEVVSPEAPGSGRRRRKRGSGPPPEAVNDPLSFIQFIADHPLGSDVEGEVDTFASHGAFVMVGPARCYLPLSAMGEPPPRSAREVLNRGERRTFVLQALDPQRRGIELALPGHAHISGAPLPETVEAEISDTPRGAAADAKPAKAARKGRTKKSAAPAVAVGSEDAGPLATAEPTKAATKKAAKKASGAKKVAAKTATKSAIPKVTAKKATAKKSPAKRASVPPTPADPSAKEVTVGIQEIVQPAEKSSARKSSAKKAAPPTKTAAAPQAAKKAAAAKATKRAVASKAPAKVAPTKPLATKEAPTKKAAAKAATKKATPKKTGAAKVSAPKKAATAKAPAKQSAPKKAAGRKSSAQKRSAGPESSRGA